MNLNGKEYFYIRNVQNDVIGLHDSEGKVVVNYSYDTWGNIVSITGSLKDSVGKKNPYRYRGYRYDEETGLYYLQSRYYNAEWGRFINADCYIGEMNEILSCNMFVYCSNNPVNAEDTDGKFLAALRYAKTLFKVARVATKVLAVMSTPAAVVVTAVVLVTVVSVYAYTRYKANNVAQAKNKPKVNNKSDNQISNDEVLANPSSRPKNYTPPGAGRHGAFREAKRKSGIPVTQTPVTTPAVDKRGKPIQGRDYDFGNGKVIRDHSGGHTFKDDPTQNRGPHINDVNGNHYDYTVREN